MGLPFVAPRRRRGATRAVGIAWPLVVLGSALAARTASGAASDGLSRAEVRADQQFATYAYAHEFGSGVYDFAGRTLQVYTLPIAWTARNADERGPGVRLKFPLTLGFLDFRTTDVIDTGLPDNVDSLSFVPGIELEFELPGRWSLLPYAQAGASLADERDAETRVFGAGARAEHTFPMARYEGLYAGELVYSAVQYRGDLPDDDFVRLRNSAELRRGTGRRMGAHELEAGGFVVTDLYVDPPSGPASGLRVPEVQFEAGVVIGTRPAIKAWRWPLPRVGISYRFAGDLSSVRFVIGAPF